MNDFCIRLDKSLMHFFFHIAFFYFFKKKKKIHTAVDVTI